MSPNYIIVIEVDNKRAAFAYQTGRRDLEAAWPRLIAGATAMDKAVDDEHEARMATYQAELADWVKLKDEHDNAEVPRKHLFSAWSRPKLPKKPLPSAPIRPYSYPRTSKVSALYKIRRDLIHMVNVATIAVAPFRITEWALETMLKWERGEHVQDLLDTYATETP